MSDSKTGKKAAAAAAAMNQKDKKVITDEQYIKDVRYNLENCIHVTQEGTRALLRQYDAILAELKIAQEKLNEAWKGPVA